MRRRSWATFLCCFLALAIASEPTRAQSEGCKTPLSEVVSTKDDLDLQLLGALRAYIPEVMCAHKIPGFSVALARHGSQIWSAGFGYADATAKVAMTPQTVSPAGSISKPYTATAIMQLVEQGRIGLADPINKHLEKHLGFKVENPLGTRPITVGDLLTHRSGLTSDAGHSQFTEPMSLLEEVRASLKMREAYYLGTVQPRWAGKVGEWHYSNTGVALLGLIVEATNPEGLSLSEYAQKNIFNRLAMPLTQFPRTRNPSELRPEIVDKLSTGYAVMSGVWVPTPEIKIGAFPAGSLLTTPSDHLRLLLAMLNGGSLQDARVLTQESVDEMLRPAMRDLTPLGTEQGLIWQLRHRTLPSQSFYHDGGYMYGWYNRGIAWPKLDAALVMTANSWNLPSPSPERDLVHKFVERWLLDHAPTQEHFARSWGWKLSYTRGLLFGEALYFAIGVQERLTEPEARKLAKESIVPQLGNPAVWDAEAFVAGLLDMGGLKSLEEIRKFAASADMRVSVQEAQRAYEELNGSTLTFGTLAGTLH